MRVLIRKATLQDAVSIYELAASVSRSRLESAGADYEGLSRDGFLLYPLEAMNTGSPNYSERILLSDHFWIGEADDELVCFLMAYTLTDMLSISRKTDNDSKTVEFFMEHMGFRGSVIYLAQMAVARSHRSLGLGNQLVAHALDRVDGAIHPAAIAEISQAPIFNMASSKSAIGSGFVPLALRRKDGHRTSCTFIKTFDFSVDDFANAITD